MRILILALLTTGIFQTSFGQFAFNNIPFKLKNPPSHAYKITQTRDSEIVKVEEFNDRGEQIFQYIQGDIPPFFKWTEPHRFIYAFEFDETGEIVKRYAFNSNAGHNIYEYEFDKGRNIKSTFQRSYSTKENDRNTNVYAGISRIKSFKDLKESQEALFMLNSARDVLSVEHINEIGKPIQIVEYSNIYRDSIRTIITYDKSSKELSRKVVGQTGDIKREVVNEYPNNNTKITTIINYRNGQKQSSHQFAEVKDAQEGEIEYSESNGVLNIRKYEYKEGYLVKVIVYNAKFNNELIVPISKKFKKVAEMEYTYNEMGLLEKEEMNNYETREKETRTYKYQIGQI